MNTVYFNLRIDENLNEKLIIMAQKEGRSKNKQIEYILKKYTEEYFTKESIISIEQHNNEKAIVNINKTKNNA